jgi:hypothetical protein
LETGYNLEVAKGPVVSGHELLVRLSSSLALL